MKIFKINIFNRYLIDTFNEYFSFKKNLIKKFYKKRKDMSINDAMAAPAR